MKTLKLFSILGLVILLFGFSINCKKDINPYSPMPEPEPEPTLYKAEATYNGSPVTAKTDPPSFEITLNKAWIAEKLQDDNLGGWYYSKRGMFLIVELEARCDRSSKYNFTVCSPDMKLIVDENEEYQIRMDIMSLCFDDYFGAYCLLPGESTPLGKMVFDIPEADNLVLLFYDEFGPEEKRIVIDIRFRLNL